MMRILSSSIRSFVALGLAATLLAGCASYGSFDENEPGLEESLLGPLVGIASIGIAEEEEQQIDYSRRAGLVAPPGTAQLPAPQAQASSTADPNWPTGSRERMAQVLTSEDQTLVYSAGVDGVDIAATQALAAGSSQPQRESNSGVDRPLTMAEMQREEEIERARLQSAAAREAEVAVRGRRYLTDPPAEARTPSPDAPYDPTGEAAQEEDDWSWWPF